ncbi:cyclophilin 14 [Novymonas esmeraldas]|uniref:Cyclophilin 14 n=1 Tax=Novymonas esmeraldas TaxID=1808958 RepID=A0AAW0EVW1_9TRYP
MLRGHIGTHSRAVAALLRCRVCCPSPCIAVASPTRSFATTTTPLFVGVRLSAMRFDRKDSGTAAPPATPRGVGECGVRREENGSSASSSSSTSTSTSTSSSSTGSSSATTAGAGGSRMPEADAGVAVSAAQTDYGEEKGDGGFHEDAIVVKDEKGNSITRIRRLPLTLVEEVPLPQRILTDLELIMMAWCEEHARQYAIFMTVIRIGVFVLLMIILYVFYRTTLSSERVVRGVDKMPADLRIGSVVYFDVTENGSDIGRIVIGLLNEDCPLYCEYFHRRCTGSGGNGDSFRGMPLAAIVPRHCLIFGDGHEMEHDVPGFNPHYLPTEHLSNGAWRGALSAIAYGPNRESPNFAIHVSAGDYRPQVFAIVIGGYNVIERINNAGSKHGNAPKRQYVIEGCGELCTLAKSHIAPMPWKLLESVSVGYDEEKFGPRLSPEVLERSDESGAATAAALEKQQQTAQMEQMEKKLLLQEQQQQQPQEQGATGARKKKKWWIF